MGRSVACILCRKPHAGNLKSATDILLNTTLDVILVVDEPYVLPETANRRIQVVHITDEEAVSHGFKNSCKYVSFRHKDAVAWDKAFYYFGKLNTSYDFVWLIEDDVFIPSASLVQSVTDKYMGYDVVVGKVIEHSCDNGKRWHYWHYITPYMPAPYYSSRVCMTGVSKALFHAATNFITNLREIPFIEGFIPTLAMHHQLKIAVVPELKPINNCLHSPQCSMPFHCQGFDRFTVEDFKKYHRDYPDQFLHAIKTEADYQAMFS
jgi:hypothetical protein